MTSKMKDRLSFVDEARRQQVLCNLSPLLLYLALAEGHVMIVLESFT